MKKIICIILITQLLNYLITFSPSSVWATPRLKIVSPSENQTILGDEVTISFIVSEINIGPEGHLLLWFDSSIEEATTAAVISNQFDHTLSEIFPGSHKLTLELVKSDETSYTPQIKKTIHFTTKLPQNSSPTEIPKQKDLLSFFSEINWQFCITILGISILTIGIVIRLREKMD